MFYEKVRHEIKPWKSDEYLEWSRQKFPDRDPHHLAGSMGSLKLTDFLLMPVNRAIHDSLKGNRAAEYAEENIIFSLNIFQEYVTYLEEYVTYLEEKLYCTKPYPLMSKWYIKKNKLKKW